ncbi:hypothetical protein GIB67_006465 [Kingdonia uniflora]|uniref:Pentatricopeptide repeat-containing protein n=1 Tax=Kingdonia uniflora TaxID=39325 RepID=A0A7J7LEQ4_9MAGN|nr:hypothetical protein GIB67_006465 [Kingdonia uniflora]
MRQTRTSIDKGSRALRERSRYITTSSFDSTQTTRRLDDDDADCTRGSAKYLRLIEYILKEGRMLECIAELRVNDRAEEKHHYYMHLNNMIEINQITNSNRSKHQRLSECCDLTPQDKEAKLLSESSNRRLKISFEDCDMSHVKFPHHDALVIMLKMKQFFMHTMMIDTGSCIEILFQSMIDQMGFADQVIQSDTDISGFNGPREEQVGKIILPITGESATIDIIFYVINAKSRYLGIMGRCWIHNMEAIASTYHQTLRYKHDNGIYEIRADECKRGNIVSCLSSPERFISRYSIHGTVAFWCLIEAGMDPPPVDVASRVAHSSCEGAFHSAWALFSEMPVKDFITGIPSSTGKWLTMDLKEAIRLWSVSLLPVEGRLDMYAKCQMVQVARTVFNRISEMNLVSWNAMILGYYCIHGSPIDGITLFQDMLGTDEIRIIFLPDEATFVSVLCACARAGLLSKGRHYCNQMANVYNVKPQFAQYWCIANLYAGAGLIQEAEKMLKDFPGDGLLDLSMLLGGLLGSCRFRGELDLGERIALHLIDLDPLNVSWYTLLATIYGVAGRWEDAEKVKMMMKKRGIQTTPRSSLLELNQVVHEFKIEDSSSAEMVEVYAMFQELVRRLKTT